MGSGNNNDKNNKRGRSIDSETDEAIAQRVRDLERLVRAEEARNAALLARAADRIRPFTNAYLRTLAGNESTLSQQTGNPPSESSSAGLGLARFGLTPAPLAVTQEPAGVTQEPAAGATPDNDEDGNRLGKS